MPRPSRREFLAQSASVLVSPGTAGGRLETPAEPPWREPGQTKDADYLKTAALRYTAEGGEIVGRNRTCFNNRPLYCEPQTEAVVLAGDRPFVRLLAKPYVLGGLAAGIARQGIGKWFHEYSSVESRYRCGRMSWLIRDEDLPGVAVELSVVPLNGAAGFALEFSANGLRRGDQLIWCYGGAKLHGDVRLLWDPIMRGNPNVYKLGDPRKPEADLGIDAACCRDNRAAVEGRSFRLSPPGDATCMASGACDGEGKLQISDASGCGSPTALAATPAGRLPIICGIAPLKPGRDAVSWVVEATTDATAPRPVPAPARAFSQGAAYLQAIERVRVHTPEGRLDAAVAAVCHAIDGAYDRNPFVFRHGCMAFSIHFVGWRVICGATALGWHDRVLGNTAYYCKAQVHEDEGRIQPQADPARRYTIEGSQSRFYGRGRIARDTHMYNTQSQFFDQAVRDWRWTADPEMEKVLRPALELHLEWARECFDPDDDGLYESYINTLPTDSVWYNGGGSVEESAYAYYGHLAAMDMARRAGDAGRAVFHRQRADKIQAALRRVLWLDGRGHFGLYVEQGGHQRVHSDAWVYSEFLPIDAGMTTSDEALQALYFTEWGLERIRLPYGGVVCQPSNWVPWKWSVRDVFGGDVCALALAYFQTGLCEEGWELLLGATLESAYASAVPGGFSHIGAGTDFADNSHMFARTVVEGLFGYDPDYPNGLVHIRPAFPSAWPEASIQTPDFSLEFRRESGADRYRLRLTRAAAVEFRLPVRAEKILHVTLGGQTAKWHAEAGFGCTWLRVRTPETASADLVVGVDGRVPQNPPVAIAGRTGEEVTLRAPAGRVTGWRDFHRALGGAHAGRTAIRGHLAGRPGHHLLVADTTVGELPQHQLFKLSVTDPESEARLAARTPREAPRKARWKCLNLAAHYNGDVRAIFTQQYLSPRPKTCSVRLGADGFSAWTFAFWGDRPPAIDLSALDTLAAGQDRILTPQNVPYKRFAIDRNIAFTSLWDNWPRSVTVPVRDEAHTAWLMLCGSTFPMETRIANAVVRFRYAGGLVESLELVPPLNFWSLAPWGGGDYSYALDAFCLPAQPPSTLQLGRNCRAMVLSWRLHPDAVLEDITLETLSQNVVIGLMGVSLMNPRSVAARKNAGSTRSRTGKTLAVGGKRNGAL